MASNFSLKATLNNRSAMYSPDGAQFQEYALNNLDYKGSAAHRAIGSLVTAINKHEMTVAEAKATFHSLLCK
jgi:hypothetical protein